MDSLNTRNFSSLVRAVVCGGALAALLDLAWAFWLHASLLRVSQSIASGLLGAAAYKGGVASALLGVLLHCLLMFGFALAFCLLAQRQRMLLQRPLLAAIGCGSAIYLLMHCVVLPLSLVPFSLKYSPVTVLRDLAVHILLVGLPISLAARHYLLGIGLRRQ